MRARAAISFLVIVLAVVVVSSAQNRAAVQIEKTGPLHGGDPIAFHVKLNEPLPKGASFDFRISPISADEQISLGSAEAINGSDTEFRVAGKLPEGVLPGQWHIAVIYLHLAGAGWTNNTIAPNDLRFEVEGKPYAIPTKAEVTLTP